MYVRGTEKERERVSECVCELVCVCVHVCVCVCVSWNGVEEPGRGSRSRVEGQGMSNA